MSRIPSPIFIYICDAHFSSSSNLTNA
jgi:hypothetical protein